MTNDEPSDIKSHATDFCCRCNKKLDHESITWLEFNSRTGHYYEPGTVRKEHSLGLFPFGPTCAKIEAKEGLK